MITAPALSMLDLVTIRQDSTVADAISYINSNKG